jgi:pyruvate dehydrogenase E2 component (dihydrolipoamide acetyltransferase)/2-oxoglutarate dehydrogenase E2 component (dihydrolipoamide succinyltransferase)
MHMTVITVTPTAMFASFCAGAFRAATETTATVVVQISVPETDDMSKEKP